MALIHAFRSALDDYGVQIPPGVNQPPRSWVSHSIVIVTHRSTASIRRLL
jgi:hypothetical protein